MAPCSTRFTVAALIAVAWFAIPDADARAVVLPAHIDTSFGTASIPQGGNTTLSFTISNPNSTLTTFTGIGFSDPLPSGLMLNIPGTNGCGGTLTLTSSSLTLSGVTLGGRQSCTISGYEVIGSTAGTKANFVTVTSDQGDGNTAQATLTVVAPPEPSTFFTNARGGGSPDWFNLGGKATVDIGVTNPNTDAALTGVHLTDTLPVGLVVASPNRIVTGGSCGANKVSAVPGSHTIKLSSVSLTAGPTDPNSICAVVVAVTGVQNGLQTNTTGIVASKEGGDAAPVTASIGVFGPGSRIYWGATQSGAASGLIQFARLNGTVAGTLGKHDGSGGVEGTAIDARAGRIYWIDAANEKIRWSSLDDHTYGVLSTSGAPMSAPAGLVIDPPSGLIYWANEGGTYPISYAHLNGTGGGHLNITGASMGVAAGPAIELAQDRIYWADPSANKISYAKLGGGGGGDLTTTGATMSSPTGVSIDVAAGRIYWANGASGNYKISYAKLNGSGGADLGTSGATVQAPSGVAIDPMSKTVYWTNQISNGSISYAVLGAARGTVGTPGLTPTAPSYPSLLFRPQAVGTAKVTGGGHPGATLTCSASWASDLLGSLLYRRPQSITYQWRRNGVAIPGANATTFKVLSIGSYTCRVTASNAAGHMVQTSPGHQIT